MNKLSTHYDNILHDNVFSQNVNGSIKTQKQEKMTIF